MESSPDLSLLLLDLDLDTDLNKKDLDFNFDLRLLDLDLDLGRFVTKSTFNFHCAHMQCSVLFRFCQPVSYTQPKISVTYFTECWLHICGINTWTCLFRFILHCIDLFAHSAIDDLDLYFDLKLVDLDLTWTWLLLDLIQICWEAWECSRLPREILSDRNAGTGALKFGPK